MPTPTTDEIRDRAQELFFHANQTDITPEDMELREGGYWIQAQQDLMRGEDSETLSYVEQLAHDVGRRLVTEAEHDKLVDLERRVSALSDREAKLNLLKRDLEALKHELDGKGRTPAPTLEKIITEIQWRTRKRRRERLREEVYRRAAHRGFPLATVATLGDLSVGLDVMKDLILPRSL